MLNEPYEKYGINRLRTFINHVVNNHKRIIYQNCGCTFMYTTNIKLFIIFIYAHNNLYPCLNLLLTKNFKKKSIMSFSTHTRVMTATAIDFDFSIRSFYTL